MGHTPWKCEIIEAVEEEDRKRALQLHAWNTATGGALYGPLQSLEITLRTAINRQLANEFGMSWYENMNGVLDKVALNRIANAQQELQRTGRSVSASQIVAILPFGFWVSLTGRGGPRIDRSKSNYKTMLWRPVLRQAFPYSKSLLRNDEPSIGWLSAELPAKRDFWGLYT